MLHPAMCVFIHCHIIGLILDNLCEFHNGQKLKEHTSSFYLQFKLYKQKVE